MKAWSIPMLSGVLSLVACAAPDSLIKPGPAAIVENSPAGLLAAYKRLDGLTFDGLIGYPPGQLKAQMAPFMVGEKPMMRVSVNGRSAKTAPVDLAQSSSGVLRISLLLGNDDRRAGIMPTLTTIVGSDTANNGVWPYSLAQSGS